MEASEIGQVDGLPPARTSPCLADGCPCRDVRIVSHRRARFFAHLAVTTHETADRIVPPDPEWALPRLDDPFLAG